MSKQTPTSPTKAYHRLMRVMLTVLPGGKDLQPTPADLDWVSAVFVKAGGSWQAVFLGAVDDNELLKRALKVAVKRGFITKAPKWG